MTLPAYYRPPTARQMQLLAMVADGKITKEIAVELGISHYTVDTMMRETLTKMGAANRAQAVAIAYEQGLLTKAAS